MKHEAKYQTLFNMWLKDNHFPTGAFELKQTQGNAIPFSSVKAHQLRALRIAKYSTLVHKISDLDVGFKPFDSFCLTKTPAYVVLFFRRRGYFIDVDVWADEQSKSTRKSIIEQRAKELSTTILQL